MKILINNAYKNIYKRGMPIYTQELESLLASVGHDVHVIALPKQVELLPNFLLNLIFVLLEQLFIPIYSLVIRSDKNIYPYNSAAVLDVIFGNPLVIYHDFIKLKGNDKTLTSRYVKLSYCFNKRFAKSVALISASTNRIAQSLNLFPRSDIYIIPNAFYQFESTVSQTEIKDDNFILLVTGTDKNKDLDGALKLYAALSNKKKLTILGCGNKAEYVSSLIDKHSLDINNIDILPQIPFEDVVDYYCSCSFVWAHSKYEGYGRAIAESKLAKKKILCSTIPPFLEQKGENTYLYKKGNFSKQIVLIEESSYKDGDLPLKEHVDIINSFNLILN